MATWLTPETWKQQWTNAPSGAYAELLLEAAKSDVLDFAGVATSPEGDALDARWVLAQSKQARALHESNLTNGGSEDAIGLEGYQTQSRKATMSAEIRRLIIPVRRMPVLG